MADKNEIPTFQIGDLVAIPCTLQNGPFPDEKLVTVESAEGPISGFVKLHNLQVEDDEKGRVRGLIVSLTEDTMRVQLYGSFFTTALGMAWVPNDRIRRLEAA
jgi:hypothetical protein